MKQNSEQLSCLVVALLLIDMSNGKDKNFIFLCSLNDLTDGILLGAMSTNFNQIIWSACAPPKCKFFSWLAVQDRIWTADRLRARGWPHNATCSLCRRCLETGNHLFCRMQVHQAYLGCLILLALGAVTAPDELEMHKLGP